MMLVNYNEGSLILDLPANQHSQYIWAVLTLLIILAGSCRF